MNVTRLAGWIVVIFTVLYVIVTFVDFGAEYVAAAEIGDKAEELGLATTKTNLRFSMGLEFVVDIFMFIILGLLGWWLTTQEVVQVSWIVAISLFVIFTIVVRVSPVMPLNVVKLSPGGVFYGARVKVPIGSDVTYTLNQSGQYVQQYIVVSGKEALRVARTVPRTGNKGQMVVLNLADTSAARNYQGSQWPITIEGVVNGTGSVAYGKEMTTVPQIRVVRVRSGLPKGYRKER